MLDLFFPSGLNDPRPHMLLGVIVRSKVMFKRPRALSQRSLSPPPKRRTSSASVENSSSDGGSVESPARKRDVLSELHDSPPADIEDIVFQYNTTQAKISSKETKDLSAKASPVSETSTPSVASSSGAASSPVSTSNSSVPSLEAQKQQLLDLQERARQYILAQTQRKEVAAVDHSTSANSEDKPKIQFPVANNPENEKTETVDDDAPYDPEEDLVLDLNSTELNPAKPAASVPSEEPTKPSSLQMLVSTLQRIQGAASKSLSPHLTALTSILPLGATTGSKGEGNQGNETTAVATAGTVNPSLISAGSRSPSAASGSSILQPIVPLNSENMRNPSAPAGYRPQRSGLIDQTTTPTGVNGPQASDMVDRQPMSTGGGLQQPSSMSDRQSSIIADQRSAAVISNGRIPERDGSTTDGSHSTFSSSHGHQFPEPSVLNFQPASSAQRHQPPAQGHGSHITEPPHINRHVNDVTQQYSGLRPEERARLAARESRLESRENRRLSSEHRGESQEQRRLSERERDSWYNNPRYSRDSRSSGSFDSRNPRDSRNDWRNQHRSGRHWHEDEHRRDRHAQPIDERPRYQERRDERRFRENWGRERWRR